MEYIGILVALVSLGIGAYTAFGPLTKINKNMSTLDKNMSTLDRRMANAEISSETGLVFSRISSVSWSIYEVQAQLAAALCCNSESLVIRNAKGKCKLTSAGEDLLSPELRETIIAIRKSRSRINNKALILDLGVTKLVQVALSKNIPPEAMMGTVITFLKQT
jgi:hypothetical protein